MSACTSFSLSPAKQTHTIIYAVIEFVIEILSHKH